MNDSLLSDFSLIDKVRALTIDDLWWLYYDLKDLAEGNVISYDVDGWGRHILEECNLEDTVLNLSLLYYQIAVELLDRIRDKARDLFEWN